MRVLADLRDLDRTAMLRTIEERYIGSGRSGFRRGRPAEDRELDAMQREPWLNTHRET